MNCDGADTSNLRAIACAIEGLASPAWEAWLLPLLTVLVPVFIAIAVARHSARVTRASVEKQIEESRKTTIHAVELQIAADRAERRADRRRELLQRFLVAAERQRYFSKSLDLDQVVAVQEATTAVELDLSPSDPKVASDWLSEQVAALMVIRTLEAKSARRSDVFQDPLRHWILLARITVAGLNPDVSDAQRNVLPDQMNEARRNLDDEIRGMKEALG